MHRLFGVFTACFLMDADDLRRLCGIERFDLAFGFEAMSPDHEVVFAA